MMKRGDASAVGVLAVAFLASLVGGCGGAARTSDVVVVGAKVYSATVDADSADVDLVYVVTYGDSTRETTENQSGSFAWSANQGTLTTASKSERVSYSTQEIIDGNVTYAKFSPDGLPLGELAGFPALNGWTETTWSGTSTDDLSILFDQDFFGSLGVASRGPNPSSILGLLQAEAASVKSLGTETVDGINARHYRAVIPLSQLGSGSAEDYEEAVQMLGTTVLDVDYWIDSSDLLRQLHLAFTIVRPPATSMPVGGDVEAAPRYPITASLDFNLSNYGTTVHIVPPSPAEITSRESCVASGDDFDCSLVNR